MSSIIMWEIILNAPERLKVVTSRISLGIPSRAHIAAYSIHHMYLPVILLIPTE